MPYRSPSPRAWRVQVTPHGVVYVPVALEDVRPGDVVHVGSEPPMERPVSLRA